LWVSDSHNLAARLAHVVILQVSAGQAVAHERPALALWVMQARRASACVP
jgi:hypothetical protein